MNTYTPEQRAFIDERILEGINEIGYAVVNRTPILGSKVPPKGLRAFRDLHDYCDANCLASLCDDDMQPRIDALFPATHGEDTLSSEEAMDAFNAIQNALHEFIVFTNFEDNDNRRTWTPMLELVGAYRKEFPDFGELDVVLPIGFIDESWHNNACPSFRRGNYVLYVDYADKSKSDFPEVEAPDYHRFMLAICNEDNSETQDLIATNDWDEIEAYFAADLSNGDVHSDTHPLYVAMKA